MNKAWSQTRIRILKKEWWFWIMFKFIWKFILMVLALWTNWRCFWSYLLNIIVIMVEFEAKTKFTSPYTINETFLKLTITYAHVLKKTLPIPCEKRKTLSKGKRLWFVPWTIRNSYICFTKPCTYTTTTTIHVTTYCTSQVTNFAMESQCMNIKWTWKVRITIISIFNEHENYHNGDHHHLDFASKLQLMTLIYFPMWLHLNHA